MFKIISISLGSIRVGSRHTIDFHYFNIKSIVSIKSSCDCTAITNDIPNQKITIEYKAKDIPEHLKIKGHVRQNMARPVTVVFVSTAEPDREQIIVLAFNATVYAPNRY